MLTALLSGTNVKRDGSIRRWNCVEYYGHHKSTNGETMLRVMEQGSIKQINLDSFSGVVLDHDNEFVFVNGQRTEKKTYYLPF
jgi:hypothetical protein